MASLVANYGTDSESDGELDDTEQPEAPKIQTESKEDSTEKNSAAKSFFSPNVGDDDDDDEDDTGSEDEQEAEEEENSSSTTDQKLPNPMAKVISTSTYIPKPCSFTCPENRRATESSVFVNQYQKAEEDKWSVLEQHVKMTTTKDLDKSTMKKKVCFSYKKGNCRRGKNCHFSHSNEIISIQKPPEIFDDGEQAEDPQKKNQQNKHSYYGKRGNWQNFEQEKEDDDSYMGQAKRKFRAGVSDTMKPPKKAMAALNKQRESERPWTSGN